MSEVINMLPTVIRIFVPLLKFMLKHNPNITVLQSVVFQRCSDMSCLYLYMGYYFYKNSKLDRFYFPHTHTHSSLFTL